MIKFTDILTEQTNLKEQSKDVMEWIIPNKLEEMDSDKESEVLFKEVLEYILNQSKTEDISLSNLNKCGSYIYAQMVMTNDHVELYQDVLEMLDDLEEEIILMILEALCNE